MDHLWSPWRMKYILGNEKGNQCVFCAAAQQEDGHENLIIARGEHAFVILNRFPYTSGHIMVVPYAHQPSLPDLDEPTRREIIELLNRGLLVLQAVYKPEGFNVGANIGGVAGAGIAEHFHFHIVPRWAGDTNFMSTLAGTRVLPEALEDTFQRIRQGWAALFEK
ncbi:MAG: HIT domain-containing protein [Chloroflexota bacterium]